MKNAKVNGKNTKIDSKNAKIGVLDSWEAEKMNGLALLKMPINCRQNAGKVPITIKEANSTDKREKSTDKETKSTDKREMSADKLNMLKEAIIENARG